ncbi:hypothetical protein CBS115989_10457 [Aspergillus niger]|uniref:Contig An04c0120, genomic contig n=2 Tax=Aspergillus niger TaxID=5061 RepID=A2QIA3_ASPNC|nr:kinase-like protein [Aspergillus niger CBS 101883]XP_059606049.1 uncharacterized protein An04g02810 [Aspergillus niger]KAI2812446.1 hypothetical protein CBS115989_10457 [Aspergillus niger]KAI2835987.1 hypothetical protein CBS11232_10313 [Aspergillus niger]KAI2868703.1 hypothetical protein CBS115988_10540 [Aspergillus niger]KAI2871207.1 hypothetical protein CBS11852_11015 [Aspergillus niger]KAI2919678.1 hypothetical protein CBS147320_8432 [Aspergillus niger]
MGSGFRDDLLQSYSDAELIQHILSSPSPPSSFDVSLLSSRYIAKTTSVAEAEDTAKAMEVAHQLGIRGPSLQRMVINGPNAHYVMDRIEGTTLDNTWTTLGWFATIKLALQLRRFVRILRSVTSSTAGSLATGQCRSFYLEDRFGLPPRSAPSDFAEFFRFWANFRGMRQAMQVAKQGQKLSGTEYVPPTQGKFVLTHHDLAPRNLLVSPSGQLWLLDWELTGFYPIYFEYAGMLNFDMHSTWTVWDRLRWYLFTWIAVGSYKHEARVLESMRSHFTRFAVARRFELLEIGGPSRVPAS